MSIELLILIEANCSFNDTDPGSLEKLKIDR